MLAQHAVVSLSHESGAQRREQGLARAGNARVRRGMIQLAWRFLRFQKESALAWWYRARTADSRVGTRKKTTSPRYSLGSCPPTGSPTTAKIEYGIGISLTHP